MSTREKENPSCPYPPSCCCSFKTADLMNKLHFPKQSLLAARRRLLSAKGSGDKVPHKSPPYQIYCCPCECGTIKEAGGINQYRECQFIRLVGGSDGKISTTNLFNSVILHFNPSLIPSLFSFRLSADACQGVRGGGQ